MNYRRYYRVALKKKIKDFNGKLFGKYLYKNMQKIITKIKVEQEINENLNYWATRSDSEKISAMQELREQYFKYFNKQTEYYESRKRLRRLYKAFKQV